MKFDLCQKNRGKELLLSENRAVCPGAFHVQCTPKVRQGICVVRRKNGQLVELVILNAKKRRRM